MDEFVFKNLSVKLLPEADEGGCQPCTELCTGCTASPTDPCGDCTNCTAGTCMVCTCAFDTDVLIASEPEFDASQARDLRAELAAHKTYLHRALAQVERLQRRPQSIEEIDALRSRLESAMAELEERRAELEGHESGPS